MDGSDFGWIDAAFNSQGAQIPDFANSGRWVELGQMWHFQIEGYLDWLIEYMRQDGYQLTDTDFYTNGNRPPQDVPGVPEPTSLGLVGIVVAGMLMKRRLTRGIVAVGV